MTLMQRDGTPETAWRCEARIVLPPVSRAQGGTRHCVKVVLTERALGC